MKWKFTRKSISDEHYVVCNADEESPAPSKIAYC